MGQKYAAVIRHDGEWWIGWVKEIPGVTCQAHTRDELIEELRSTLVEMLEINRQDAVTAMEGEFEEVTLTV